MIFEKNNTMEKVGEKVGYLFSYFLFTTILFYILFFLEKMPDKWSYFHVMGITLSIVILGIIIKRLLR